MTDLADLARTPERITECCDALDRELDESFREQARSIARRAELKHPINRAPSTITAAAIYLTGLVRLEQFSQQEIATAAGVSAVALRNCYPELATAEDITLCRGIGQAPTQEVER